MKVTVARIYIHEGRHIHERVFQRLHDDHKVKGVTVFRGITGFGKSGHEHSSSLLDMSFDLPVVVEFFDSEENVQVALASLSDLVPPGHTITFKAELPDV
jgi:PII-like signaling protein